MFSKSVKVALILTVTCLKCVSTYVCFSYYTKSLRCQDIWKKHTFQHTILVSRTRKTPEKQIYYFCIFLKSCLKHFSIFSKYFHKSVLINKQKMNQPSLFWVIKSKSKLLSGLHAYTLGYDERCSTTGLWLSSSKFGFMAYGNLWQNIKLHERKRLQLPHHPHLPAFSLTPPKQTCCGFGFLVLTRKDLFQDRRGPVSVFSLPNGHSSK